MGIAVSLVTCKKEHRSSLGEPTAASGSQPTEQKASNTFVKSRQEGRPEAKNTTSTANDGLVGVPECDTYLIKYEQCINAQAGISESARKQMKNALAQTREAWQQSAATAQGKAGLIAVCNAATEVVKKRLQCAF